LSERIKIIITPIGRIPEEFMNLVKEALESFYRKVVEEVYVEVYIYATRYAKLAYLEEQALRYGALVVGDFVVMHEAWSGWPKIHVDYEYCSKLEEHYVRALLIHEAAHSILHGSPQYYIVSVQEKLLGDPEHLAGIYLASTIVKDMDVYRFLYEKKFVEEVETYSEFIVKHQIEDKCSSLYEVLMLAKNLVPCIYIDHCIQLESLRNCREKAVEVLDNLKKLESRLTSLSLGEASLLVYSILKSILFKPLPEEVKHEI